ncbi:hypothetical protein OHS59_25175 [Streptomyces sp. NBC_00414]|uniref:hypothetical protein n=1 Tax=Streptomyces sp. NBC_00414 TaxID=2975739 RepID=UPI002E223128
MSITQQYLLDTYRAQQHGDPTPPAPGAHDWQVMRELPDHRRFRAALTGRPVRGRVRAALTRLLGRTRPRSPSGRSGRSGARSMVSGERVPRTP